MVVVFDLSEVLIRGLLGIEGAVARLTGQPEAEVLPHFWGENLDELILGRRTETAYLEQIISERSYPCSVTELQHLLRENFKVEDRECVALACEQARKRDVFLLSDHAREWAEFILRHHGWLGGFKDCAFSFQFGKSKRGVEIFEAFMARYDVRPADLVFIDDNPRNLVSARSCGIDTVQFESAAQLAQALASRGL